MHIEPFKFTCQGGSCPAVYKTDRGTFLVQGERVTDPEALAAVGLPEHETLGEVPASLLRGIQAGG